MAAPTGRAFGDWTVVSEGSARYRWLCACVCGLRRDVSQFHLLSGASKSCGHKRSRGNLRHGHSKRNSWTGAYRAWASMHERCKRDPHYVSRGITVCRRWGRFENFLADMGDRPSGLTLDRKDGTKGYSPSNCRWATWREQGANTTKARPITFGGETFVLNEWARRLGINHSTLHRRLKKWPIERALSTGAK